MFHTIISQQLKIYKRKFIIGKNAYQLLYFGQYEESLNLAKLAVKINKTNEKLWLTLAEAQVANKLYEKALISLIKHKKLILTLAKYTLLKVIFTLRSHNYKRKICFGSRIKNRFRELQSYFSIRKYFINGKNLRGNQFLTNQ